MVHFLDSDPPLEDEGTSGTAQPTIRLLHKGKRSFESGKGGKAFSLPRVGCSEN